MKQLIVYAVLVMVFVLSAVATAQKENLCEEKSYEDHNQIDYKPLKLAKIQGKGLIEIRDNAVQPNQMVPGACVTLFTLDKRFVMSVKADANGNFQFGDIASGQYRLVARARGFCTANIPIHVVKASRKSRMRNKEVVVHFRVAGIDTCSWGELREKNTVTSP